MKKLMIYLTFIFITQNILAIGFLNEHTGLGFGLGSGGYEVKGIYRFNSYFSSSLEYNTMGLDNITMDDLGSEGQEISASGTLKISAVKALLHFHPFGNGFRVSAGYTYNLSDITVEIEGTDVVLDNGDDGVANTADDIKSDLTGSIVIDTGSTLPYIGIGFGYSYEDFIKLDLGLGIQFIPKIKGSDLLKSDVTMSSDALDSFIGEIAADLTNTSSDLYIQLTTGDDALTPAQVTELNTILTTNPAVTTAIASGDPFELYTALEGTGVLESFGITADDISGLSVITISRAGSDSTNPFSSLPNPNDYVTEVQNQIDTLVEESGLGMIQDILGYAPLPVFSIGFTLFFY